MICKWEEVEKQIVDKLQYFVDMQNICKNIDTVAEDLETLDSIIYEDDEERGNAVNDDPQDDCEVREMKHQLFEVRNFAHFECFRNHNKQQRLKMFIIAIQ